VAAVDLLAVGRDLIALVGEVALDDRREQGDEVVGRLALLLGLAAADEIDLERAPQDQRPRASL
jgi:hypothetical protein